MVEITLPDGRTVQGTKVDYEVVSDPWGEYELADGTTLKARVIAQDVVRIDPEDHNQGDEPLYQLGSDTQVRSVDIPDELMADSEVDDDEFETGVA